jgi:hypothetical protein
VKEREVMEERQGPDFIPASGVLWTVRDDEPVVVLGWVHISDNHYDPLSPYGQVVDGGEVYDTKADAVEAIAQWREFLREQEALERQHERELDKV